jgi:hypothetical protein
VTTSFVSGTGGPLILEVTLYEGGALTDLLNTPTITITSLADGGVVTGPTATGVTHPAVGVYVYTWTAPVSGGTYLVVWDGSAVSGSPLQSSELVSVYAPSTSTVGPCDGWDIDTSCCGDWDTYSDALQQRATDYATMVMWAATGRRFGLCTRTVRPCGRTCQDSGTYGYYWSEGTWMPYILNGVWRNCWCGGPANCGCNRDCQVYLPGPVNSIISVTVDGDVVDPTTYRVDNGMWLVRTHDASTDDCWPLTQNYNLNSGEDTFIVSYLKGLPVPASVLAAAGELACEYAKACLGAACRLPSRATSIARQGVSISMVDVDTLLQRGLTGVTAVDQVIRSVNPGGLSSPMRVSSPDVARIIETTWTV